MDGRALAFLALVALLTLGAVGNADVAEQYYIEADKKAQLALVEMHAAGRAVVETCKGDLP